MPVLVTSMDTLIAQQIYPLAAVQAGVEGDVTLEFVVTEEGRVVAPEVIAGIGHGCDAESKRLLIVWAHFEPGHLEGNAVRVRTTLTIPFRLPQG